MKRNEFFKLCAGGVCSCAAITMLPGSALFAANPMQENEDWRIGFIQERYAKLIEILGDKLGYEKCVYRFKIM